MNHPDSKDGIGRGIGATGGLLESEGEIVEIADIAGIASSRFSLVASVVIGVIAGLSQ